MFVFTVAEALNLADLAMVQHLSVAIHGLSGRCLQLQAFRRIHQINILLCVCVL